MSIYTIEHLFALNELSNPVVARDKIDAGSVVCLYPLWIDPRLAQL